MQTRMIYALTMATSATLTSAIAITVSEFSESWMIFVFPFLALITGGLTGWLIPAKIIARFGESRTWAALSGMACAFVSMTLCASLYVVFLMVAGSGHISASILEVLLFCNFVTQIACGLFAYPGGALAGLAAHHLSQKQLSTIR